MNEYLIFVIYLDFPKTERAWRVLLIKNKWLIKELQKRQKYNFSCYNENEINDVEYWLINNYKMWLKRFKEKKKYDHDDKLETNFWKKKFINHYFNENIIIFFKLETSFSDYSDKKMIKLLKIETSLCHYYNKEFWSTQV